MFLSTLDQEGWQKFLTEFNQKVERKVDAGLRATEGMGGNCDQFR